MRRLGVTILDYAVVAACVLFSALGWRRGFVRGALALASSFLGFVLAANFYPYAGALLAGVTTTQRAAELLGFALIFVATVVAGSFAGRGLRNALDRSKLGGVDRLLGALAGLGRAWLVCSALYLALTAFPFRLETVQNSAFAPALIAGTRVLAYLGSDELRGKFAKGYDALQKVWRDPATGEKKR